ncbi:hypothetical protein ACFYOV_04650 [Streptomyces sp. NPDC005931]|uniref:hypothetical protein n=1 Tax=Streptomyces sp. NPDC005931 TaxID=3364737 RepID=UPI0036AFD635
MSAGARVGEAANTEITVVGHADLTPDTLALVESELRARLEEHVEGRPVMVRSGTGVPLVFGRAARATGRPLVVVIPTTNGVPAVPHQPDRVATGELLSIADQVRLVEYDPADRDSCVGADERMVAAGGHLLAVWDGSVSNGRDATAHLVAYARANGVPVEIVWPAGAAREAVPVTAAEGRVR